jgi:hypothetical protein
LHVIFHVMHSVSNPTLLVLLHLPAYLCAHMHMCPHASLPAAAFQGHTEVVQLLLHSGAAADDPTHEGFTALHYAASQGHSAVVALLLNSGAAVDGGAHDGTTPLHDAALGGHGHVVAQLLARGAAVTGLAADSTSPVHAAVSGRMRIRAQCQACVLLLL